MLEIRTLHAVHGRQLLGPYSRFVWSHPGPVFFYLAAPIYRLCHLRGPGLNLFVFGANLAAATALVLTARRLRGDLFAFGVGVLLALYETVGAPFPLSGEWNPMTPILPLALLFFLAARLGSGAVGALPAVAFVASAIVQTHLGFAPVVVYLCATGALFCLRELYLVGQARQVDRQVDRRHIGRAVALAVGVSALLWVLPLYEDLTRHPGNLGQLRTFFLATHRSEHSWRVAVDTVAGQLAIFPLAVGRALGRSATVAGPGLRLGLAAGELTGLGAALGLALRRRDQVAALLSAMALGTIVVAAFSVRAIRGEIEDYLVAWISVLGFLACAAIATLFLRRRRPAAARVAGRAGGRRPAPLDGRPLRQRHADGPRTRTSHRSGGRRRDRLRARRAARSPAARDRLARQVARGGGVRARALQAAPGCHGDGRLAVHVR